METPYMMEIGDSLIIAPDEILAIQLVEREVYAPMNSNMYFVNPAKETVLDIMMKSGTILVVSNNPQEAYATLKEYLVEE